MVRRIVSGLMSVLLVLSMFGLLSYVQPVRAGGTIYIRANGSIDPPTAPISTVDNITYTFTGDISDSIVVERDNIVIYGAGHTVQGTGQGSGIGVDLSGRTNVTVNNAQVEDFTYGIWLGSSSSSSVSGNNLTANFGAGILLDSACSDNSISGNNVTNNFFDGICDQSFGNNSISGNNITGNGGGGLEGIGLYGCSGDSISGNNIANNAHSIELYSSSNNSISGNNITNNVMWLRSSSNNSIGGNTFTSDGLIVYDSYQNFVENNTVNGKPLVYLEGVADYSVGDAGQVILVNCDSIRVENLSLSGTAVDVQLWETNNCIISRNSITASGCGIWLYSSSSYNIISENNIIGSSRSGIELYFSSNYNSISGNNITANHYCGIELYSSSNNSISENNITANNNMAVYLSFSSSYNIISRNNITSNGCGIWLYSSSNYNLISENNIANNNCGIEPISSSNNEIYHNSFINNLLQVSSEDLINVWDYGYPSGGNYWSDYNGTDVFGGPYQNETGSDGIGDTAYIIDVDNTDHYPLMSSSARWIEAGENVTVSFSSGISLVFDNVTSGGMIMINETIFEPSRPIGFILPMKPPVYYDIVTTVSQSGNVTVCIAYNDTGMTQEEENSLKLMHWDETLQEWVNITTNVDTANNTIYGKTSSLSPFAIMLQTIPGDINGDFKCALADLSLLAKAYNTRPGDARWNPNADINGDGKVALADLSIMAKHYNQQYP